MSPDAQAPNAHESPPRLPCVALALVVFSAVLAADLASKQWAWDVLKSGRAVELIPHVLYLKFGFNTGASFSFLSDVTWARSFFISIGVVALGTGLWLLRTLSTTHRSGFVLTGLFAAGVTGNLHDRLMRIMRMPLDGEMVERHGVIDFIQFYYDWAGRRYWPIFNIADMAMVSTALLLFVFLYREQRKAARVAATAQNPAR